jgi:hypothetical protein
LIWLLISFGFKNKGIFPFHQDILKVKEKKSNLYVPAQKIRYCRVLLNGYICPLTNVIYMRFLKNSLAVSMVLTGLTIQAQFSKGDRMVGASVGSILYNSGTADITVAQIGNNSSKVTSFNVSLTPSMGWFISSNTAVGAVLNINPTGNKTTYEQNGSTYQSDKSTTFNIGLGGFVRHYLNHSGSLMPFGQFGVNMGFSTLKTEGFFYGGSGPTAYKTTYDGSSNGGFFVNATVQGGLTKMVGENAGLDFYIGYNYAHNNYTFKRTTTRDNGNDGSIDETGTQESTTKFTNHGFLLGVGFQVFIRKKK